MSKVKPPLNVHSQFGIASCVIFGMALGWAILLYILRLVSGDSFILDYGNSYSVLVYPVAGALSLIGLISALIGFTARDVNHTSCFTGIMINIVLFCAVLFLNFCF